MPQISKHPLTPAQLVQHKLPPIQKLTSAIFKKCGHPAQLFEAVAPENYGIAEIDDYCWGCKKSKR